MRYLITLVVICCLPLLFGQVQYEKGMYDEKVLYDKDEPSAEIKLYTYELMGQLYTETYISVYDTTAWFMGECHVGWWVANEWLRNCSR